MTDERTGTGPVPRSDGERSLFHHRPWWFSLDFVSWAGLVVVPLVGVGIALWRWLG